MKERELRRTPDEDRTQDLTESEHEPLPRRPEEEEKERQRKHEGATPGRIHTGRILECDGVSYRIRQTAAEGLLRFEIRSPADTTWGEAVDYDVFVTQQMTNAELFSIIRFGWEMHKSGRQGVDHTALGTLDGVDR